MNKSLKCNVCSLSNSVLLYHSQGPFSITSDLRIWPASVEVFQCEECGHIFKNPKIIARELGKLYSSYKLFDDLEEEDQAIFISGKKPKSRSSILIESLPYLVQLPESGKLLDVGCNKGLLLRKFSSAFPTWTVSGHELSRMYEPYVRKTPKLERFYYGNISKIKEKFDLITLVHTLEHILTPRKTLRALGRLLAPGGTLLVQVPNLHLNAFDILIFEHISHFFPETLEQLLINSNLEVISKSQQLIPKEMIFVTRDGEGIYKGKISFGNFLKKKAKMNVEFLRKFAKTVKTVRNKKPIVIFGAAEVGTWAAGLLENKFDFFVDESPWRIGSKHLGVPILHPKTLRPGQNVILGMAPIIAKNVYAKWKGSGANFIYPNLID